MGPCARSWKCPANPGNYQKPCVFMGFGRMQNVMISLSFAACETWGRCKNHSPRHHPKNRPTPCRNSWGTCRLPDWGCWTIPGHALGKCLKSHWGIVQALVGHPHQGSSRKGVSLGVPHEFPIILSGLPWDFPGDLPMNLREFPGPFPGIPRKVFGESLGYVPRIPLEISRESIERSWEYNADP